MKNSTKCQTLIVLFFGLLLAWPLQAASKMERLKNSLHTKVKVLAEDEVESLSEAKFDRLSRNMDRALERMSRNSEKMNHLIDEWEEGLSDWDHVAICEDCNRNAKNIFRGTGLEWMVPDLLRNPSPPPSNLLPSGAGTLTCGCHGFVIFGNTRPNPRCASGYDMAMACAGWCPAGGQPWGARCT